MARDEGSGVDKLKDRLYARGQRVKKVDERSPLSKSDVEAPTAWADVRNNPPTPPEALRPEWMPSDTPQPVPAAAIDMPKKKRSFATLFFFGSAVFFLLAVGVSALLFFGGVNTTSPRNIDVEVIAPSLVDGGKEVTIEILVTNRNTTTLELADLVVEYPEGVRRPSDPTQSLTHERISIGTIKSGEQLKRTVSAIFYGPEGTQEKITARLEYSVAGSNSVFERVGETALTIGSSPVSLSIEGPAHATAGDQFTLELTVRSNAPTPVENVAVEAQYPFGFSTAQVTPLASGNNTLWRLGTLAPGAVKTVRITGSIEAADGDERVFRFFVWLNSDQTEPRVKVPFLVVPQTLTVEKPFISGTILVDGKKGSTVAVAAGKTLQGTIEWENNLPDPISNLEFELSFAGPALDKNSISSQNGFYQSSNSAIVWTSSGDNSLQSVPPGGKGTIMFSFASLPVGAGGSLITNPSITLALKIKAQRQGASSASDSVSSVATTRVVLASALSITAQSWRSSGSFSNTGPVPPRAEAESTYTITWTVKNSANTVANGMAQATLPPYTRFVAAESGSGITYDEGSRAVRWALGDIKPGVGYISASRQGSFQVAFTPSISQVGSAPALIGTTLLSGFDRFVQVSLEASTGSPTTATGDGANGSVVPK